MANTILKQKLQDPEWRINALLIGLVFVMPFGVSNLTYLFMFSVLVHSVSSVSRTGWISALKNPVYIVSGVFFLYYALSLSWAIDKSDGLSQLETKLSFLAAPLIVASNIKWLNKTHLGRLKWALVYGSLATMVIGFAYAIYRTVTTGVSSIEISEGYEVSYFAYTELSSPFMHVAYLSSMVGVATITVFHEFVKKNDDRVKHGILLVALLFYMFMLQGRMNVLALIIVLALAFFIYVVQYKNWKWLFLPILPIVLVILIFPILPESVTSRYLQLPDLNYDISGDDFNSATYRFAEWKGARKVISENFLFGTGVGDNRNDLIQAYSELKFHKGVEHRFNAHNQYLETFIASGLIGLILVLVFLGSWFFHLYRAKDLSSVLAFLFFLLCMLTESMLERAWAVMFLAIYFSVMIFSNRPDLEVKKKL